MKLVSQLQLESSATPRPQLTAKLTYTWSARLPQVFRPTLPFSLPLPSFVPSLFTLLFPPNIHLSHLSFSRYCLGPVIGSGDSAPETDPRHSLLLPDPSDRPTRTTSPPPRSASSSHPFVHPQHPIFPNSTKSFKSHCCGVLFAGEALIGWIKKN